MLRTMKYVCTKEPMLYGKRHFGSFEKYFNAILFSSLTLWVHENHSFAPFRPFSSTLDILCIHTIGLTTHSECGIVSAQRDLLMVQAHENHDV